MSTDRRSTFVLALECPRCGEEVKRLRRVDAITGILECERKRCHQRWWATRFEPGPLFPQVAAIVGDEIAPFLMQGWAMPALLDQPTYWQLQLSDAQYHAYQRESTRSLIRAMARLALPARVARPALGT